MDWHETRQGSCSAFISEIGMTTSCYSYNDWLFDLLRLSLVVESSWPNESNANITDLRMVFDILKELMESMCWFINARFGSTSRLLQGASGRLY